VKNERSPKTAGPTIYAGNRSLQTGFAGKHTPRARSPAAKHDKSRAPLRPLITVDQDGRRRNRFGFGEDIPPWHSC